MGTPRGRVSTAGRRRRRAPWAARAAAGVAIGLVVLSRPATELGAHVAAVTTPFRAPATTPAAPVVGVLSAPAAVTPELPETDYSAPALAVPAAPNRLRVELPHPLVPHGTPMETSPPPAMCGGYANPRTIPPGAVPGVGSATVSWQADGHSDVRGYRVQAVSQQLVAGAQPPPIQVTAAQPEGCVPVTVTVTGLISGVAYVFWLEEQVLDATTSTLRYVQVGTSSPVVIG